MTPLLDPSQPLRVRIVGPIQVFLTIDAYAIIVKLRDGFMQINKRYSSVIERLKEGEIRIKVSDNSSPLRYYISSGWLISSNNLCEILVKDCKKIENN